MLSKSPDVTSGFIFLFCRSAYSTAVAAILSSAFNRITCTPWIARPRTIITPRDKHSLFCLRILRALPRHIFQFYTFLQKI